MKSNNLREILIYVFVSCFVGMICGASAIISINNYSYKSVKEHDDLDLSEISRVYNKIRTDYFSEIDDDALISAAIDGMLSTLDSNTSYLDSKETANFNYKMIGEYKGIGVETLTLDGTGLLVMKVLDNSIAYKEGIREGDIILKVDEIDFSNKTSLYFKDYISSTSEELEIEVNRNDKNIKFILKPETILIDSVHKDLFLVDNRRIGYLKIDIFALNTASQFINLLNELETSKIDSLIIDVRDNAGGYLSNVSTILEKFMKSGTILYKTENKDLIMEKIDSTEDERTYPVVVLINGSSASASEVLAASFKENYNSELVGTTTYGKGTVQEIVNISESTMAKITTKKWLTPNGDWINEIGIEPTIEVNSNSYFLSQRDIYSDNQISKAIEIIVNK